MSKIWRYEEFLLEQPAFGAVWPTQTSMSGPLGYEEKPENPKWAHNRKIANVKMPSKLKTMFHMDKQGDWSINPAKTKPEPPSSFKGNKDVATSWNEYPTKDTILATKVLRNPTDEVIERQLKLGWSKVWEETEKTEKELPPPPQPSLEPFSFQLDPNNDFFELGGFTLTTIAKNIIKSEFECSSKLIQPGVTIDKIKIEASTDKTRLTENLQKVLKDKSYEPNNKGLSTARADSLKAYILSLGLQITESNFDDYSIKFEQGKEGGYDPQARYVRVNITTKVGNPDEFKPKTKTEELKRVWFQKLSFKPRIATIKRIFGGTCRTYE